MQNPLTKAEIEEGFKQVHLDDMALINAFKETVTEHLGVTIPEENEPYFMKLLMTVCISHRVLRERRNIKYN